MIENVIVSAVGILVVLVCAVPVLAWLEKRKAAKEEAGIAYAELRIVTAGCKPACEMPIKLRWPSIYDTRDVIFAVTEGGRGEYIPIVSVEARSLTAAELRELEGRN